MKAYSIHPDQHLSLSLLSENKTGQLVNVVFQVEAKAIYMIMKLSCGAPTDEVL